jgi:hypothetical protein
MPLFSYDVDHFKYKEDAEAYAKKQNLAVVNVVAEDNDEAAQYLSTAGKGVYLFDMCGSGYNVVVL